jgi:DoxX
MSTLIAEVSAWRETRAKFAPYAPILLRLIVGYGFLAHGLAKWSKGPQVFAGILQATGVPLPHLMAWVTIATEIVCGMAFLIGAFVDLVSIPFDQADERQQRESTVRTTRIRMRSALHCLHSGACPDWSKPLVC